MKQTEVFKVQDYPFESNDFLHYFKNLYRDRGVKAFYQLFNRPHRRSFSRSFISKHCPFGVGLEIGCGRRTICPTDRTVLSDAFSVHGIHDSIAKVFFKGENIPYAEASFDFLVSEHVLEHIANPIKALTEWIRVLKPGAKLYIFLPHKDRNNDCERKVTPLSHLIEDFEKDVPYNDPTHWDEWYKNVVGTGHLADHYKHMDKKEMLDTASIHFHVWTEKEIVELFKYLNLEILEVVKKVNDRRDSFAIVAKK